MFFLHIILIFIVLGFAFGMAGSIVRAILRMALRALRPRRTITGTPYVLDGDGLAFDGDVRVRLYGLDAPEMDHPEGPISKDYLKHLIAGRPVRVVVRDQDKYGRLVGQVFDADGRDINAAMVADGYARAYTSFAADYAGLERRARKTGAGLWGQGGLAIHPELWRKAQR